MKLVLATSAILGFLFIASPAVHAGDDYDGGKEAASDLNEATRQAGKSYRRFLPTWAGGKAINDQNKKNDREFEEDK